MSRDDDNDKKNGKKDYEVGYGKPPKNRQFGAEGGKGPYLYAGIINQ